MSATAEQLRVIEATLSGPHLVDAGAGTGKTFTLVERAAALVTSGTLEPENVLVVTFTRVAAAEIAGRLDERLGGPERTGRPTCGTFHQIAASLLREFAYATGGSPDIRAVDDARARGVFATAFREMLDGRLDIDTSVLPLLDSTRQLERDLAAIAVRLKNTDVSIDRFEREALAAAGDLERLPFFTVGKMRVDGKHWLKDWPIPDPPLSIDERSAEAERERRNVRAVATLFRRFDALLAIENLLTFGDVLTRATAMLHAHPEIVATLRARWLHALVDEFQDTNPVQVAFLKALFGDALRPVMVVGDVRQAIYAFNGADPDGIVHFRTMDGCALFPLTENRRSYAPILAVAHAALSSANAVPPQLHNVLAAFRGATASVAVRAQQFEGPDGGRREAEAVARTIRELVDRGTSPRNIAVLLRSRTKAPVFAAALRDRGLAVQLHGGAGFFDAPEIREVVAWLRLVEKPDDAPSLVVALQSAAIGLGDGVVASLAAERDLARAALSEPLDGRGGDERARLERFRAIVQIVAALADVPLADAVRRVVSESGAEVARLGGQPGKLDQARANLDKFVRLAADFAQDRPSARIADFLRELEEREALDDDEAEAELEGERVAIMTVHAAKGLEWDHVFVANVSPSAFPLRGGGGNDVVVKLDERRRALAFKNATTGRSPLRWAIANNTIDESTGNVLERETDDREEHRLFYVALTRARDVVYVTGRLLPNAKKPSACLDAVLRWISDREGDPADALLVTEDASAHAPPPMLPLRDRVDVAAAGKLLDARIARGEAPSPAAERRGTLSYTAIELHDACPRRARYHYVLGLPDLGDEAPALVPEGDGREPGRRDPARFGRIVHLTLEAIAVARIARREPDMDAALDAALDSEDEARNVAIRNDARRAVEHAAETLRALTPLAAEQRFDVELDGIALGGYVDLLARDAAGRLAIVDYKTGTTPAEHYAMQFALYRYAVGVRYPEDAATLLLRTGPNGARLEPVAPASAFALSAAVAAAHAMSSDEPKPGLQCRTCPYAANVCDAALR